MILLALTFGAPGDFTSLFKHLPSRPRPFEVAPSDQCFALLAHMLLDKSDLLSITGNIVQSFGRIDIKVSPPRLEVTSLVEQYGMLQKCTLRWQCGFRASSLRHCRASFDMQGLSVSLQDRISTDKVFVLASDEAERLLTNSSMSGARISATRKCSSDPRCCSPTTIQTCFVLRFHFERDRGASCLHVQGIMIIHCAHIRAILQKKPCKLHLMLAKQITCWQPATFPISRLLLQ